MKPVQVEVPAFRAHTGWRLHCPGLGITANILGGHAELRHFARAWVALELGREANTITVRLVYADEPTTQAPTRGAAPAPVGDPDLGPGPEAPYGR